MILRIFLIGILTVTSLPVRAQFPLNERRYLDSLHNLLQTAKHDSAKAKANLLLADYWTFKDAPKARSYMNEGKRYGRQHAFLMAVSVFYEANLFVAEDKVPLALDAWLQADTLLGKFNTSIAYTFRAKSWLNYGIMQQAGDEKLFADILLNKVIPLARQAGDNMMLGKVYHDLSLAFRNTGQYEKAEVYCLKGIEMCKQMNEQRGLVTAYNSLAEVYVLWKQYPKAHAMLDSADALLKVYPDPDLLIGYYTAESMYLASMQQYEAALAATDKGIALAKEKDQRYPEQRLLMQQYEIYTGMRDYRKAMPVLRHLAEQPEMMERVTNRLEIYKGMATTSEGLGEMQPAYQWMQRYALLSDSVHESRLKNDIQALEVKYRNAEHQQQIVMLKAKNERAVLLMTGVGLLLLAAVFGLLYYRKSKRLAEQQLKDAAQQQQLQFSQALLLGEERERRRMAGDLHDGLGGMLAGVKMNIASMAQQDAGLHKVIYQLDNSIHELRRIARNMMPESLLAFGLETALKDLCDAMITNSVQIRFQSYGIDAAIPQQKQMTIYRIVQELLANAIRHADASDIFVQCTQQDDIFFVTLEDNGKGFDTNIITKGIGLGNVRNRVDYLKGRMDISSAPEEGTTINIELHVA